MVYAIIDQIHLKTKSDDHLLQHEILLFRCLPEPIDGFLKFAMLA